MATSGSASGAYSGRTSNVLVLDVWRVGVSGNNSAYAWQLSAVKTGNTSYALDQFPWYVNVAGDAWSGTHSLDFRSASTIVLASGQGAWKAHDAAGNLRVDFAASHVNADIFGTAQASGAFYADQLPTLPAAPTPIGIDQVTNTGFRYRFSGAGGGAATAWQIQLATSSTFADGVISTSSGTSLLTGLTPGKPYWIRSRGINGFGNGPWSAASSATTLLNAPELTGWTQTPDGAMSAVWTAPAPATGLLGYRLQIATDAGFTAGVQLIDTDAAASSFTVTGGIGGRTYYARVAARTAAGLSGYSVTRSLVLVLAAGDLDGWTRYGAKPAGVAYFTAEGIRRGTIAGRSALVLETLATAAATIAADATGIQRTITGLTVGKAYRFQAGAQLLAGSAPTIRSYRLRVVAESSAVAVAVTAAGSDLGYIEFVADAATVTLQILAAEGATVAAAADQIERVAFYGIQLLQLATDYPVRLRETVYESSLANHFDLACNSVGASWYVGKQGVTQFRLPGTALPVSATFTDEPAAGALHYIEPAVSYDTRGMVNRLDVTNYGVDPADRSHELNDDLVVTSAGSIDLYGVRSARLETNLWDKAPYDESLNARLADVLYGAAEPRLFVSAVRWNAQEDLAAANALDVGQRVLVRFNGTEQDSQIVALQHDITPRRWIVTVALQRVS